MTKQSYDFSFSQDEVWPMTLLEIYHQGVSNPLARDNFLKLPKSLSKRLSCVEERFASFGTIKRTNLLRLWIPRPRRSERLQTGERVSELTSPHMGVTFQSWVYGGNESCSGQIIIILAIEFTKGNAI